MKQFSDPYGVVYTASGEDSIAQFNALTRSYMGFRPETGDLLKTLLISDPDMPMAHCVKGYIAKLIGCASHSKRATGISERLNRQLESVNVTDRERGHAAALSAWCNGNMDLATEIWEKILLEDPLDGMALRLAHFMHFYSGDGRKIRDSMARTLSRWPDTHPEYGFLLGMYGFGLEEAGDFVEAEKYARRAVEINPADSWSVHAVAHVMEMTERHEEGIEWIISLKDSWSTVNNFRFHLYWHQCLFHLERDELDEALKIYDEQVVSDIESGFYLDICNASSLLWRLEMFNVEIGERWLRLADVANEHLQDRDLIFVSLHYLMPLIATADKNAIETMMKNLRDWSKQGDSQGRVTDAVGLTLAQGLQQARTENYEKAFKTLVSARYSMDPVGGSMAQRDLFSMITIDMARKSGNDLEARGLLAERVASRPDSRWAQQGYADVLSRLGARKVV